MDPLLVQSTSQLSIAEEGEEDEWDTDGFVIPSLTVGDSDMSKPDELEVKDSEPSYVKAAKEEVKIYLGPHGGRSSSLGSKQQEPNAAGSRKQKLKQKLKEADWKFTGAIGRENKMENIRQLVGSGEQSANTATMPYADYWKFTGAIGRENKMENIRQLVGSGEQSANTATMPYSDYWKFTGAIGKEHQQENVRYLVGSEKQSVNIATMPYSDYWKFTGAIGKEHKQENVRYLVGSEKQSVNIATMPKWSSPRDWLDPHCHEAEFERSYFQN